MVFRCKGRQDAHAPPLALTSDLYLDAGILTFFLKEVVPYQGRLQLNILRRGREAMWNLETDLEDGCLDKVVPLVSLSVILSV